MNDSTGEKLLATPLELDPFARDLRESVDSG
jgi:hypothetical protein